MKRILAFILVCTIVTSAFAQKSKKKDYVVTIKTKFGDMVAILYDETPKHKANFIKLAKEHYYDSTLFHRVMAGFMIQGGDPNSKNAKPGEALGNGGPEYTIDAEINSKFFHEKGALAAARMGDQVNPTKASSGSQFYIVQGSKFEESDLNIDQQKAQMCYQQFFQNPANKQYYDSLSTFMQANDRPGYTAYLKKIRPIAERSTGIKIEKEVPKERLQAYTTVGGAPHLDGSYTVFGKVIKGLDVIDKIASQPRDASDRPNEDVRMAVTVEELSKKKIKKLYGYTYPDAK